MCGICGIVHGDPGRAVDGRALERMNAALIHRGPDEAGVWVDGQAGLAARRLRVLDLAHGSQPMRSPDGALTLVFNGELYNFRELRDELEKKGRRFVTMGDTEVALHALHEYGENALGRFNGMFALAVYDARRRELLLVRDRLGVKPLFYTVRHGTLAFASELDALRQGGWIGGEIQPGALDAFLAYLYIPAPETIFEGVYKLRPGELLRFRDGRAETETWWRPELRPDPNWTLDSAAERYWELLGEAVRLQRVSDVPLGAFLSGGIDSTSVVARLAELESGPVKTFSIGFEDPEADERPYARLAAKHLGVEHHEAVIGPEVIEELPRLVRHFGEPFADSSLLPTWSVSKLAREYVTVALSGDGGDELFAGYSWTHIDRRVDQYRRVPGPLRRLIDVALRVAPAGRRLDQLRRFSADSFLDPLESCRRRHTAFGADLRAELYQPDFAQQLAGLTLDRFTEHYDTSTVTCPETTPHALTVGFHAPPTADDRRLRVDFAMYLPDDILTKVDRMSMAVSLEARVPILDHRIVEFAGTVPYPLKHRGRVSKRLVKRALEGRVPEALLRRRKRGFALPIHRWFRESWADVYRKTVLRADAHCLAYVRWEALEELLGRHQAGAGDEGHRLFALLIFESWLRRQEGG